jgi:hypothetical protein
MIDCAYCQRPLECAICRTLYLPPSREHYEALSRPDIPLNCPECGAGLICHWCKSSYDGLLGDDSQDDD